MGRERGESMLDEDTTMWKEGERSFMEAQKGKKILFERVFSLNKKINAVTEVKENHYLLLAACGTRGGHLGIFWVGMFRPGLQIGTPF